MNGRHSGYLSMRSAVMSDYEPTSRQETPSSDPESGKTSGTTAIGGLEGAASASPLPPRSSPNWPISASMSEQAPRPRARRSLSNMRRGLIVAAAAMGSVTGLFVGLGASSSAGAAPPVAASSSSGHFGSSGGQGSNARSGPAAGGSSGTIGNVAKSNFTLTTTAGQEVTVDEEPSTKYERGTTSTSKSTITKGEHVLVLGTVSSTTIKATHVIAQTTGSGSKPTTAATVVPSRGVQPKPQSRSVRSPPATARGREPSSVE